MTYWMIDGAVVTMPEGIVKGPDRVFEKNSVLKFVSRGVHDGAQLYGARVPPSQWRRRASPPRPILLPQVPQKVRNTRSCGVAGRARSRSAGS